MTKKSEPKPVRVPRIKEAGYSIDKATARKPPVFKWNCPADVVIVAERLKQCRVSPDNLNGDVSGLIVYGRDMGMHPNKIFLLLQQAFPFLANDAGHARSTWEAILQHYCDAPGAPGMSATGGDAAEQTSDGAWSVAYDATEFRVLREWQWINDSKQYIHDDGRRMMDDKQFARQFGYLSPKTAMWDTATLQAWLADPATSKNIAKAEADHIEQIRAAMKAGTFKFPGASHGRAVGAFAVWHLPTYF